MPLDAESPATMLPNRIAGFVGRESDLAATVEALESDHRLVSIVGYGGVGKTRLAIEAAHRVIECSSADAYFVDLYSHHSELDPSEKISAALRIPNQGRTALDDLTAAFANSNCLLVLDNCEQDVAALSPVVLRLLENAPRMRILLTSRCHLGLPDEQVIGLPPLDVPPETEVMTTELLQSYGATQLFMDRARGRTNDFMIDEEEAEDVADLCRRLDGLPLSLELAAARVGTMSVSRILAHLTSPAMFELLDCTGSQTAERHSGLHQIISWSRERCSDNEKLVWNALAVFLAPPTLTGVRAVVGEDLSDLDVEMSLDSLASKAVITVVRGCGDIRFRMPVTTAEFALAECEPHQVAVLRERHRHHFVARAKQVGRQFWNSNQVRTAVQFQLELRDFVSAWERSISQSRHLSDAAEVVIALHFFWTMGGAMSTGRRWLRHMLDNWPDPDLIRADLLWTTAWVEALSGNLASAARLIDECEQLHGELSTFRAGAWAATISAQVALFSGRLEEAERRYDVGLSKHRERADVEGQLMSLFQASIVATLQENHTRAQDLCNSAYRLSDSVGDLWGRTYAMWADAFCAVHTGDHRRAAQLVQHGLQSKTEIQDRLGIALLAEIGGVLIVSGSSESTSTREGALRTCTVLAVTDRLWKQTGTTLAAFGPLISRTSVRASLSAWPSPGAHGEEIPDLTCSQSVQFLIDELAPLVQADVEKPPRILPALTTRESQEAELLQDGLTNREIADILTLSPRTVESHVERVLRKLGVNSRTSAAVVLQRIHQSQVGASPADGQA